MKNNKKNIKELEISFINNLINIAEDKEKFKRQLSDIILILKPDEVTNKDCRNIYKEMIKQLEKNQTPDIDTIYQKYDIDIENFLHNEDMVFERPIDFATALIERKNKKSLANIADNIKKNINKPTKEIIEDVSKELTELTMKRRKKIIDYKAIKKHFIENVVKSETPDGIATGFSKLDNHIVGLKPGELIVIGARPSEGKTTLAINLMRNLILKKKNCLFFSYEMNSSEIFKILTNITSRANEELFKIRASIKKEEHKKAIELLENYNHFINFRDIDEENHTIDDLKAEARMLNAQRKIDCIFVDYLQLIKATGRFEQRRLEIGTISRKLKLFAKELEIPIVLLSQLNRATESRNDKKPMMSDLKESGDIEQDANTIILIFDEKQDPENAEIKLLIKKARGGKRGEIDIKFYKNTGKFFDY